MTARPKLAFDTLAKHPQVPWFRPFTHTVPLFLTSAFPTESLDEDDEEFPWKYARIATPNGVILEHTLASLEGGDAAAVVADGMRAISVTLMSMLDWSKKGMVVSTTPLYSHTYLVFTESIMPLGKACAFLEMDSGQSAADSFQDTIRRAQAMGTPVEILFIETPANPTLAIWDIAGMAEIAHANNIRVIVDSTFASPYNQRPLEHGADLVIHSLTKYCCGHGTTLGGIVIGSRVLIETIKARAVREGGHMHPMAAWLIQEGLKTLPERMEKHNKRGLEVARFLASQKNKKKIAKVYYPGLHSHQGHEIAQAQMRTPNGKPGFGGMVSFELARPEWIKPFADYLAQQTIIELVVSLGSTTSMFTVPARKIHGGLSAQERQALGISDTLVRFSVGLENVQDIKNALALALDQLA